MDSFKVVLSNTEYIGKDGSSMSEKSMRSLNCTIKKKFLATLPAKAFFNALNCSKRSDFMPNSQVLKT